MYLIGLGYIYRCGVYLYYHTYLGTSWQRPCRYFYTGNDFVLLINFYIPILG